MTPPSGGPAAARPSGPFGLALRARPRAGRGDALRAACGSLPRRYVPLLGALLAGCGPGDATDTASAPNAVTDYVIAWETDPAPPRAAETARFTARVLDQDGAPVPDLQQAHARMLHTVFLAPDLSTLLHLHHEDFAPLTADDLRTATYSFPLTPPWSGRWRLAFDFAHQNRYQQRTDWMDVTGDPAAPAPDLAPAAESTDGTVLGTLTFATPPAAGVRADWTITLTDAATGAPITDLAPWLGTDGHVVMSDATRDWVAHTHAWFPGMEQMAPGHPMPHLYDGPELPFQYAFPSPGPTVLWLQFARAGAPDAPHTLRFVVDVGG